MEHVTRLNALGFLLVLTGILVLTFGGLFALAVSITWWGPIPIIGAALALIFGGAALAGYQRG